MNRTAPYTGTYVYRKCPKSHLKRVEFGHRYRVQRLARRAISATAELFVLVSYITFWIIGSVRYVNPVCKSAFESTYNYHVMSYGVRSRSALSACVRNWRRRREHCMTTSTACRRESQVDGRTTYSESGSLEGAG